MPERSPRLYAIALAAVLALIASIAGCGGGGSSDEDVKKVLDQTFNGDKRVNSGKLNLNVSANLEGDQLSGPVALKLSGPFEGLEEKIRDTGRLPRADITITVNAAGQNFRGGGVSTGDKLFVGFQGRNYVVPDGQFGQIKRQLDRAQRESDRSEQADLGSLGIRPRDWLEDPSDEGTEEVGGADTVHISAGVNVEELLDDFDRLLKRAGELGLNRQQQQQLPDQIPRETRDQIKESVKDAKIDLYTGEEDKILRRLDLQLDFELPQQLRRQAGGLRSGEIKFSLAITELNQPQEVSAPRSARPLSELQDQLGAGGFGSLGGSSGGSGGNSSGGASGGQSGTGSGSQLGSGGGTGPNGVSQSQSRRYLRCVEQAKGQQELTRCSDLLR